MKTTLVSPKNLSEATLGKEYTISSLCTKDDELKNFLFTLGCYEGEKITVVSVLSGSFVVSIMDARYSMDKELVSAIKIAC